MPDEAMNRALVALRKAVAKIREQEKPTRIRRQAQRELDRLLDTLEEEDADYGEADAGEELLPQP